MALSGQFEPQPRMSAFDYQSGQTADFGAELLGRD